MKKLFLLFTGLLGLFYAHSQAISPDPAFAGKGWTYADFKKGNYYFEYGRQVLLQKDGSYLLGFEVQNERQNVIVLARYFPNGTLDASFGNEGFMESVISPPGVPMASNYAQQSDGKIVMAGRPFLNSPRTTGFILARYHANGSPDSSFGKDGIVSSGLEGYAFFLSIDGSDRILVAGTIYTESEDKEVFVLTRFDREGVLDKGFGSDGKVILEAEDYPEEIFMAIEPGGKIVVAGNSIDYDTWKNNLLLARYNPDGSPDVGFDEDGKLVTDFFNGGEVAALAIQNDGKIVLAGGTNLNTKNSDFALRRYNTDGSVDNGFGAEGELTTDFGGGDYASSLAVQGDGKIVAAGITGFSNTDNFAMALARYHEDGSPDASFDDDGRVTTDFGDLALAYSLAVQSDGKLVVAGITVQLDPPVMDYALARYNTDGSLDSGFDGDGKLIGYYPVGLSGINSLAVQSDGKIVVAGGSGDPILYRLSTATLLRHPTAAAARRSLPLTDVGLARYNVDGSLDTSFGENGKLVIDLGGVEEATSVVVQADGKILIAGMRTDTEGYLPLLFLARINADGTLDSSFDGDGKLVTGFFTIGEEQSVVLQRDGKIVVTATVLDPETGNSDFAIARYNPDGTLDNSFNGNGRSVADFGTPAAAAFSLAIQDDGKILAIGVVGDPNTNTTDFALARYNTDGSLDPGFDEDGKLTTDFTERYDYATSVAIQADGKIVVGGLIEKVRYGELYVALSRYNQNGALDSSFDGDGKLTSDLFEQEVYNIRELTPSLALQSNGKIVVAGTAATDHSINNYLNFALVRYNSDGSLDSSFGNKGQLNQDFQQRDDMATSIQVAGNRLYVVGASSNFSMRGIIAAYLLDCKDKEVCGNRVDDNCDGQVDEGCPAQPFLTINDVTVSEDLQRATLMVTLSKKTTEPVSFSYFTQDRTATSKANKGLKDFESESGTLTIPAGQQTAVVSINILDDNLTEGEEYFDVHLQRPVHAALSGDKGRVTIQDGQPSVGIGLTSTVPEKEERQGVNRLTAKVQPNPSAGAFTLVLQSPHSSPVAIKVTDAAGRLVEAKAGIAPNTTLQIGSNYRPGTYYAEVVQGHERVSLKLVKGAY